MAYVRFRQLVVMVALVGVVLLHDAPLAQAQGRGKFKSQAADFPIGLSTNGQQLRMSDYEGKAVVLVFFEAQCPKCRQMMAGDINTLAEKFVSAKTAIRLIAVSSGDSLAEVQAFQKSTGVSMPVFVDTFRVFEYDYGYKISLNNIFAMTVIGPDGKIIGYELSEEVLDDIVNQYQRRYVRDEYPTQVHKVIDAIVWKQYDAALRQLRPLLNSREEEVKTAAEKLMADVRSEGEAWQSQAEQLAESQPVEAFDLYTRLAQVFANDELGKSAAKPLAELRKNKAVMDELAARRMMDQLYRGLATATSESAQSVAEFCQSVVAKYPETPTAQRLKDFAERITPKPKKS